jgi:hypothetical protein
MIALSTVVVCCECVCGVVIVVVLLVRDVSEERMRRQMGGMEKDEKRMRRD